MLDFPFSGKVHGVPSSLAKTREIAAGKPPQSPDNFHREGCLQGLTSFLKALLVTQKVFDACKARVQLLPEHQTGQRGLVLVQFPTLDKGYLDCIFQTEDIKLGLTQQYPPAVCAIHILQKRGILQEG